MIVFHTSTTLAVLLLYMEDIIIIGSSPGLLCHIIHLLSIQFPMKDPGDLHYFPGVQVVQTSNGLFLS